MSNLIYYRMVGYVVTLIMHVTNLYAMHVTIKGGSVSAGTLEEVGIQTFKSMEYRYLTTWNVLHQIGYAMLGLSCDILIIKNINNKNYKLHPQLRALRNFMFAGVIWPGTMVVSTLFWTLFTYDRSLVYPEFLDKIVTKTSNHVIHTAIVPVVLWEVVFRPRQEPKSHLQNISQMTLYIIAYAVVLHFTYYQKGVWLYPILEVFHGTIYFPLLHLFVGVLTYTCYFAQWKLNRLIHRDSVKKVK